MSSAVPEGWIASSIGELAERVKPGPFGSSLTKSMYVTHGYKIYGQEQVIAGDVKVGDYFVSREKFDELSAFVVEAGDILISLVGTFGRILIVPDSFHPGIINPRLLLLRFSKEDIDTVFMAQQLRSSLVVSQLNLLQQGGTMGVLSATTLKPVKLNVPPLPEQKKIASILTSVDEVIEQTESQIAKLQDLKTGMMQELLTKGISHTEFKDSPVGRIPVRWEVVDISSAAKVIDCKHATPKYFDEGYPVVKPGNIQEGMINLSGCSLTDKEGFDNLNENHKPVVGDIIYSRNQTYGIGAYVDREVDFCIGQDVCIIHPILSDPLFTYYAVNSPTVKNQVEELSAGSTFKRINLGSIRKLLLPLPTKEEQKSIASALSSVDQRIEKHKEKRHRIIHVKKALMQDLLTGKVRVEVT